MAMPLLLIASVGSGLRFHASIFHPAACRRLTSLLPISPRPMNPILVSLFSNFVVFVTIRSDPGRLPIHLRPFMS